MSDTVFPYDDEVADPYADDDTKNPHEPSGEDSDEGDEPDPDDEGAAPPKRRPGRPKKTS
jgi:hypothetical protein